MKKGKIKTILEDHWNGFLKIYENKIRDNVKKEVEKVLKCKEKILDRKKYATLKRRLALHVKVDFVLLVERFIQIIGLIIC